MLDPEIQEKLKECLKFPKMNIATLHVQDDAILENLFESIFDEDLDYSVEDLDKWLRGYFLGIHETTRKGILEMAKAVKFRKTGS